MLEVLVLQMLPIHIYLEAVTKLKSQEQWVFNLVPDVCCSKVIVQTLNVILYKLLDIVLLFFRLLLDKPLVNQGYLEGLHEGAQLF